MSVRFDLGFCDTRSGGRAYIIRIDDSGWMSALHCGAGFRVKLETHHADGRLKGYNGCGYDLIPNATLPDPLAEARAAVRKWMTGAAAPTHRANIGRDVWALIERLAQEPDE